MNFTSFACDGSSLIFSLDYRLKLSSSGFVSIKNSLTGLTGQANIRETDHTSNFGTVSFVFAWRMMQSIDWAGVFSVVSSH